jgi:hypothetical protein
MIQIGLESRLDSLFENIFYLSTKKFGWAILPPSVQLLPLHGGEVLGLGPSSQAPAKCKMIEEQWGFYRLS